ncbi:amino acid permease [Gloeobacter violaceus]|uniref:amino acid permease n=1 Tax=Gloeobacter violaceus TaxID=33072 RepID=UPI0002EAA2FC|nr:amino acid permease [Gloeobacter violaceus]
MTLSRYLLKKTVADLQKEGGLDGGLKRTLGPINLISLGVGAIIGAGIFVITGQAAAQYAGPAITISFILAAFACAFAGLCYAEFAALLPISGSAYTYAYATLGELVAWIIGWDLIIEYALSAATVAVGWSGYVVSFLRDFGIVMPPQFTASFGQPVTLADGTTAAGLLNVPAVLIILALSLLLVVGVSESASVNGIIVVVKVAVIVAFLVFGASYIDTANWTPFIPEPVEPGRYGYFGILRAAGVIFFAYIGFDAVSTAAQEAKNPQRDMPIGILGSLVVCTVLYILVALVLTGIVDYRQLGVPDPIAVGVDAIGLGWLTFIVKIGAIAGLTSVMLVTLYGQTRIFYTMSRDGLLPPLFSAIHPRFKTPYLSTMLLGLFVSVVAGLVPLGILGELVSIGTLFAFIVVSAGVLFLRYRQPDLPRPFRCPLVPWVPLASIVACLALMSGLPADTWLRLFAWLGLGLLVYFVYGRVHSKLQSRRA